LKSECLGEIIGIRNAERARIKWMFTTDKGRAKMGRAYPKPLSNRHPLKESKPLCRGNSACRLKSDVRRAIGTHATMRGAG
jgi:hypothetical protein